MTDIVVDASVTSSWCFPEEQTPMSLRVLDRLKSGERALVPSFWSVEVLNVLLVGERRGRITPNRRRHFSVPYSPWIPPSTMSDWNTSQIKSSPSAATMRLTPYDALYVELALSARSPLATLDEPQRKAAQALGVTCL